MVSFGPPVGATILAHLGKMLIIKMIIKAEKNNFFNELLFLCFHKQQSYKSLQPFERTSEKRHVWSIKNKRYFCCHFRLSVMSANINSKNSLFSNWSANLVGTSTSFSLNLLVNLTGGLAYSFKVVPSIYLLILFGIVSPILFTLCLYHYIKNSSGTFLGESIPGAFVSRDGNRMLMLFDIFLIVGFALLIYFGPLNYFLFRFLQTAFFPCMMLVLLRFLYLSQTNQSQGEDDEWLN